MKTFKVGEIYAPSYAAESDLTNSYLSIITKVSDKVILFKSGKFSPDGFIENDDEVGARPERAQAIFGILLTDAHISRIKKSSETYNLRLNFAGMRRQLVALLKEVPPTELQIKTLQNLINELKQQADEKQT